MKNMTTLAIIATVALTSATFAADRPERPERPEVNGTTTDEVVTRPERPTDVTRPEIERPDVPEAAKRAAKVVHHTRAELDRIKEALRRLRANNRDLTDAQIQAIKEKLLERARAVVARAKSAKERIEDLKPRLGNRDKLFEKAREKRDQRQEAAKAATGRERD